MRGVINFLYNIFILAAAGYHFWTCFLAYKVQGLGAALLSAILPIVSEVYWIYQFWGRENYQLFINCGFGIGILAIIFAVVGRD